MTVDRFEDRPPHPPVCVAHESHAPGLVESFRGAQEPEVPFVDEVGDGQSVPLVAARDGDYEAQVRGGEATAGAGIPSPGSRGECDLLIRRQERYAADLLQVAVEDRTT